MEELNIREVHEIPTALTKTLLDSNTCSVLLKAIKPYYSYEALLAEFEEHSADRKNYMQDYTPQCVLDIIGGITPGGNVRDVCAGIGGLSLAKFKADNTVTLRLEEYSKNAIAFMLLNLLIANIDAEVVEKNVLTGEELAYYKVESAASGFGQVAKVDMLGSKKYDTVISNPPYSQSWIPQMDARFEGYKLAPKSKADFAFILDGIHSLNATGTAAFILPHGVLFRGQAEGKQKAIYGVSLLRITYLMRSLDCLLIYLQTRVYLYAYWYLRKIALTKAYYLSMHKKTSLSTKIKM